MKQKLPSKHPVFRWLAEHTASLINRFKVNADGRTAFQALHGKKYTEKVIEFGEQVLYNVPRKLRSKLTRRWCVGTYCTWEL